MAVILMIDRLEKVIYDLKKITTGRFGTKYNLFVTNCRMSQNGSMKLNKNKEFINDTYLKVPTDIFTFCIHLSVIIPAKKLPAIPPISKNVTANPAEKKANNIYTGKISLHPGKPGRKYCLTKAGTA